MKIVYESLDEINEGKFGRMIAGAALAGSLLSTPQIHAQERVPMEQSKNDQKINITIKEFKEDTFNDNNDEGFGLFYNSELSTDSLILTFDKLDVAFGNILNNPDGLFIDLNKINYFKNLLEEVQDKLNIWINKADSVNEKIEKYLPISIKIIDLNKREIDIKFLFISNVEKFADVGEKRMYALTMEHPYNVLFFQINGNPPNTDLLSSMIKFLDEKKIKTIIDSKYQTGEIFK